jgi:ribosome-associated toxin RatA of RatAB toxin-antitoxin module
MSAYDASQTVTVTASAQECFDALTDYERLPDWQRALKRVEVIERGDDGAVVEYVLDAKLREVSYRLQLAYDAPRALTTTYVSGDFRDLSAAWRFADNGDGTTDVLLELRIDPGRFIPGPVRSVVQDVVMGRAMSDLKRHVER